MTRRVDCEPTARHCERCGFTRTYRTPAQSAYHFDRHACDRRVQASARAAAYNAKLAAIDRTPKTCAHKRADHRCGTYAKYVLDACRCRACVAAAVRYEQQRVRKHAYGRFTDWVDAEPARAHCRDLMARGMGYKRIAEQSGVNLSNLSGLLYGKYRGGQRSAPVARISAVNADKLLAVTFSLAPGRCIDTTGTRRRVQALVANGWSICAIARLIGMGTSPTNLNTIIKREQVQLGTARKVAQLYEQLWDVRPPATNRGQRISVNRSIKMAAERGWAPPLAWDDGSIDDPDAVPQLDAAASEETALDEVLIERLMDGTYRLPSKLASDSLGYPELHEAVRRLAEAGLTNRAIGERVGRTADGVLRLRQRHLAVIEHEEAEQQIDVIAAWSSTSEDVALALLEDARSA